MAFDAETTCKSLATRITALENALKAQAENKVASKMEALEKTITALKAADARDTDTVKALKAQSEKQAQALETAMKKKDSLSVDQKSLDELKKENDLKLSKLENSLDTRDKAQRAALEGLMKAEMAKRAAENNAAADAARKQAETQMNQGLADANKAVAEGKKSNAEAIQKMLAANDKAMAEVVKLTDTAKLEARLLQLEALVKGLAKG